MILTLYPKLGWLSSVSDWKIRSNPMLDEQALGSEIIICLLICLVTLPVELCLVRNAFVRTNCRAVSVRPSACLSGTGMHCDHTVHFSTDLSLWFDSPMFWYPETKAYLPAPSCLFSVPVGREVQYGCANYL